MSELNLHQKLVEIRKEIDVFKKDTEGFNYSYVSGSQVLSKIQNKMNELNVLLYPKMKDLTHSTFDYLQFNKKTKNMDEKTDFVIAGNMTYVWQNADKPEETLDVDWNIFGQQDDISKAYGSGLTYSERYFLLKFFNAPTDDDDPDKKQGYEKRTNNKASEKQLNYINTLLSKKVNDKFTQEDLYKALLQKMNTTVNMEDWTSQQASQAIKILSGDSK